MNADGGAFPIEIAVYLVFGHQKIHRDAIENQPSRQARGKAMRQKERLG